MSNTPIGIAKVMKKGKNDKAYWNRVGALFPTKNPKVHKLILDAVPVDGVLFLTENEPKEEGSPVPEDLADDNPF